MYLFDEPTDALDQNSINMFIGAVNDLIKKDKIVIITTHEKEYFKNLNYEEINF